MTSMKKKGPRRIVLGIIISVMVFAFVLLALSSWLRWPTSVLTLGIMLVLAWFLAAGVGGRISKVKWSTISVAVLAVLLVLSTLGFGIPWDLGLAERAHENVLFKMEASFTYLGSEGNLPIENVAIRFPCPNVDNVALPTKTTWKLYYQDEDNVLHLEADQNQVYGFKGNRSSVIKILLLGIEPTIDGPKLYCYLDRLYSREVFWTTTIAYVHEEDINKVTLRVYGDNLGRSSGSYQGNVGLRINLSMRAQLSRKVNDNFKVVEIFGRSIDNCYWNVGIWLYPY